MAVIVLMYHHTPDGAPDGFYDVPLWAFREQIDALVEADISFVKFSDCSLPEFIEHGTHVAVTFDDGHASNEAAFRFLNDRGIQPMAMIVRDWSTRDRRYLSAGALADLEGICDLGAHGASHRAMTSLSAGELADELAASRDYVEGIVGAPIAWMALPGGHGGARELAAAAQARFELVGNSRPMPHARRSIVVNRICINRTHDAAAPLRLAKAGPVHWALKSVRFAATAAGRKMLGGKLYGALTAMAK